MQRDTMVVCDRRRGDTLIDRQRARIRWRCATDGRERRWISFNVFSRQRRMAIALPFCIAMAIVIQVFQFNSDLSSFEMTLLLTQTTSLVHCLAESFVRLTTAYTIQRSKRTTHSILINFAISASLGMQTSVRYADLKKDTVKAAEAMKKRRTQMIDAQPQIEQPPGNVADDDDAAMANVKKLYNILDDSVNDVGYADLHTHLLGMGDWKFWVKSIIRKVLPARLRQAEHQTGCNRELITVEYYGPAAGSTRKRLHQDVVAHWKENFGDGMLENYEQKARRRKELDNVFETPLTLRNAHTHRPEFWTTEFPLQKEINPFRFTLFGKDYETMILNSANADAYRYPLSKSLMTAAAKERRRRPTSFEADAIHRRLFDEVTGKFPLQLDIVL